MSRPPNPRQTLSLPPAFRRKLFDMLENGKVYITDFGTFEIVDIPSKVFYHNFSKRLRKIKAFRKLKFIQNHILKDNL